ncbi:centrin [Ascoidea rubescens DSM 1968]|uniref:Nuclear pore complex subunit n=1 Tax=Ascoidea rubescens DSM 1968 TaxID=1344418 RepID=A0A1D2VMA1_9ASCO|nr:nuclear pore complex subunit [Ascoidea rubescens DSM 1968]ODV62704.1 nuclear pore complex subunit [Ascoidea rubescens DSM 1968]
MASNINGADKGELLEEQKQEIREAFHLFDLNNDGHLGFHELKIAMKALGFEPTKKEVLDMIAEYDVNDKNLINYDNFFQEMGQRILERDKDSEIERAFKLFDEDSTGKISLKNLRRVAKELGDELGDDELRAMIDEFDLDDDGEINFDEFKRICQDD